MLGYCCKHMPKMQAREAEYLSTSHVAEILGITKRTLKNWLKAKWIPEPERNPANRYRRWTVHDVEEIRRILSERNRR